MKKLIPHRAAWLALLFLAALGLQGCSPQGPSPGLGISFAAQVKQSALQAIRSFRVLAFEEGKIYRCNPTTHTVRYGTAGFVARATFDWQANSGETPEIRLFLPKDALSKGWVIQVEAFTVARLSQTGERPIATGCVGNVRMFDERPVNADVVLHSTP